MDLTCVRPSIRLSVSLAVCLPVNMFVDGLEFVSVLAQFHIKRNILIMFKKKSAQWSWRRCDNKTDGKTDRWTNGQTDAGEIPIRLQKSSDYIQKS